MDSNNNNNDQRIPTAERRLGEHPPPNMEPSAFRSVRFKDLFKFLVSGTLFVYTIYPLFPVMVISTVCRVPKVVRSGMCRPGDVAHFQLGSLFEATELSAKIVTDVHQTICHPDAKIGHQIKKSGSHEMWNISDKIDESYYRRSQIDEILTKDARRSQAYHEVTSRIDILCNSLADGRETSRRLNRDLVSSLYQTTGTLPQLLQRVKIATVSQSRVDELADAVVAPINMTFEKWKEFRVNVDAVKKALANLDKLNLYVLNTGLRVDYLVNRDLDMKEKFVLNNRLSDLAEVWSWLRLSRALSEQDLQALVDSLHAVRLTAIAGREDMKHILLRLRLLDRALNTFEEAFGHMRATSKAKLLEDWELYQEDIVLGAARWRQHLAQRYTFKTWGSIFLSKDNEGRGIDAYNLLLLIYEPVEIVIWIYYGMLLLPASRAVRVYAAALSLLPCLVFCWKTAEEVVPWLSAHFRGEVIFVISKVLFMIIELVERE